MMDKIKIIGNYMNSNHDASRVVDINGIAPTVKENHGTITGIVENMTNDKIKIRQNTKQGWIEMDNGGVANMRLREPTRGRVQGDGWISPTVMAGEPSTMKIEKIGQISSKGSQCGTVVSDSGLYPTISAGTHGYGNAHMMSKYKIRKLTEKECFRLMGVKDEDYEKILPYTSKSGRYKLAGNSIVVPVLMALFSQLNIQNIPSWNEIIEKRSNKE